MNIQKKLNVLFARGGTCHAERLLPELVDNNLLISDRQLSDHLRFLYLYTDLLAYYDTNNVGIDQNVWRKFLEQDNTVIRSLILHTSVEKIKKSINKQLLTLRRSSTGMVENKYTPDILMTARELMILLEYWHKNLSNEDVIRSKLDAIIHEEINIHLSKIYKILQQHAKNHYHALFVDFCSFVDQKCHNGSLWELKADIVYNEVNGPDLSDTQAIDFFDDFFDAIFNTIYKLKELCARDYFDTLKSRDKAPHMALLIAFLQLLLQYADAHLNHIPQRTLDHYYRHILKFNNNPAIPDEAYIHFSLSPNHTFAFVPGGGHLVAKNPFNGEDILFKTKRSITVNQAKVAQINSLLTTKKNDQEGYKTMGLTTATYNQSMLQKLPFPLFPVSPKDNSILEQSHQQLAIMVGSPLFHLAEGMRTIHIKFKLTPESFQTLISRNQNKQLSSIDFLKKLAELINTIVNVQITTKTGWFSVPEGAIAIQFIYEESSLSMVIALNAEVPAMEKLLIQEQGNMLDPGTPTVAIGIRDDTSLSGMYLLNLLNGLALEKIDLKVSVKQYRGLVLQNQLGIIDNSQIFEPFGPLAKPHSNFYIGSGEIFSKNLTALQVDIKWEDMPTVEGGFKRYYNGYPNRINNDDFKVNVSYLNHQHWNPFYAENRQCVPLFQVVKNNKGSEQLDYVTTINDIDVNGLGITKTNDPLDVAVYGPNTIAGFLKLQLSGPEQAFGHAIYPSLMSSILVKNAQKKQGEETIVLNEPYTPRIKSITVDYEAEESINLTSPPGEEEEKYLNSFFHISAFGYSKIFPNKLAVPATLLPFIHEAASFIAFGIADLNSNNFSMHVAIGENSFSPDEKVQQPEWFYLSDNIWLPLHQENIVVDRTKGFSKSGIIVFNLPGNATKNNTYMTTGLIWIKAQFIGNIETLPTIVGVYTQAVTVSRVMDKNGVFSTPILPPKTIQKLQHSIDGIELVVQPSKTFNGRQFENHQAFYRRVSERLRHKNRAISAWDYERIILEKFPEIFRVKCINHTLKSSPNIVNPGHITLVIITKVDSDAVGTLPITKKPLLASVKEYIQHVSTPFIKFEVVNPVYEDVKVNVTVKFKPGFEKGLFLNTLQQDLRNFLSPWLFNVSEDVPLGGDIPASKIIDFINNRNYIEGIGNFSILKYVGKAPELKLDKVTDYNSHLFASYPWSIMVSAKNHKISAVDKFDVAVKLRHGSVGDMAIGEDFIVGPWTVLLSEKDPVVCSNEETLLPSLEEYCLITQKYIRTDHGNH
ncbi:baseplate J/gp47 family protein [Cardinium endosymbiont of Tipula unca]|uniref:baseplate J/gp47 family protein n=1 Tax=Cardinium endosymbiont of Tipula unca TaxID=3066216 RepID=UPI0030D521A1